MTRTRSHPRILQVLLALLLLAWLPASGMAVAQDEFAVPYAGASALEEWGEDGEGWPGVGGPSDDDPTIVACGPTLNCPGFSPSRRQPAVPRLALPGAAHPATGPPAV